MMESPGFDDIALDQRSPNGESPSLSPQVIVPDLVEENNNSGSSPSVPERLLGWLKSNPEPIHKEVSETGMDSGSYSPVSGSSFSSSPLTGMLRRVQNIDTTAVRKRFGFETTDVGSNSNVEAKDNTLNADDNNNNKVPVMKKMSGWLATSWTLSDSSWGGILSRSDPSKDPFSEDAEDYHREFESILQKIEAKKMQRKRLRQQREEAAAKIAEQEDLSSNAQAAPTSEVPTVDSPEVQRTPEPINDEAINTAQQMSSARASGWFSSWRSTIPTIRTGVLRSSSDPDKQPIISTANNEVKPIDIEVSSETNEDKMKNKTEEELKDKIEDQELKILKLKITREQLRSKLEVRESEMSRAQAIIESMEVLINESNQTTLKVAMNRLENRIKELEEEKKVWEERRKNAIVLEDFVGDEELGQLSLQKGENVLIIHGDNTSQLWWFGQNLMSGKHGVFPNRFVTLNSN